METKKYINNNKIKGILQGLMRYRRMNTEDMDTVAHIIVNYLNDYISSNGYTIKDKPLHEALEYYEDTLNKHYD